MLEDFHIKLENAIENNHLQSVIELLEIHKHEINDITDYLWLAIDDGNWDIAKVLTRYGTINHNTSEVFTPLVELLFWENPDLELLIYLLKDGSNPNYSSEESTQLHDRTHGRNFGTTHGFYEIVNLLLQYGSQVYLNIKKGLCNCSVLTSAIVYGYDYNMITQTAS